MDPSSVAASFANAPSRGALLLFAKAPHAGRVKTRMVPPWSPEDAARFAACLLDDALEASARAALRFDLEAILCVEPAESQEEFEARLRALGPPASTRFRVRPQRGSGLGERIGRALAEAARDGHCPLLLRGCDSPNLCEETLSQALEWLGDCDLVLRPDADGGYSLVGLREPVGDLFDHAMGHAEVLQETLARARARGLATRLLAPGFDVDRVPDLERLAQARRAGRLGSCPRTLAFLDRERLWPATGRS